MSKEIAQARLVLALEHLEMAKVFLHNEQQAWGECSKTANENAKEINDIVFNTKALMERIIDNG